MLESPTSWSRVSDFVAGKWGLGFPAEKLPDLRRAIGAAATELGFRDAAACADWMLTMHLSSTDLQVLAAHLTIGETYFFRDAPLFNALAGTVLPTLLRRRGGKVRQLRLWSAGCCTGEEAYSLAILLHQLIPDLSRWHVSILGTDINVRSLHKATAGVYGEWSFRNTPDGFKERWFQRTHDSQYVIIPEVKRLVTFRPANLAEAAVPAADTNAMDLILCRNVLMYFTPEQASKVVDKLHGALASDGWLAVSPTESSRARFPQFAIRNLPGTILFPKDAKDGDPLTPVTQAASMPEPRVTEPVTADVGPTNPRFAARAPAETRLARPATVNGASSRELPQQARALANDGKLAEALEVCDRWIAGDRINTAGHYLRALVLLELGDPDAAATALQRTLYLEPKFVAAHFALGNASRRSGRHAQAKHHFRIALHLLARYHPDEPVPESDGLTAGKFGEIIRELMAVGQPAPRRTMGLPP